MGRLPTRIALRLAAAALAASTARAEPETGTRIDAHRGSVETVDGEEREVAVRVMNTFGRCVARSQRRMAQEILALPLYSAEQEARIRRFLGGQEGCLGVGDRSLRFKPRLLVGGMAEWLVEREGTDGDALIAEISDDRLAEMGLEPRTGYEDFALCVARRDPAAVRALIATRPASDDEEAAISRLMPDLGPCLPTGQTVTFDHPAIRNLVAVGLYRLVSTPAAVTPSA